MLISFPVILPLICTGGLPSSDSVSTPIVSKESNIGCIGLFLKLSSPVSFVFPPDSPAMAIAILIVVPEFPASIIEFSTVESIVLLIVTLSSTSSTSTPNPLHALIVDIVSFERKIFFTMLFPSDNAARNIALCV